jgi:hypothetical protein
MTRPIIIGLAGYAGTGKDTVRELLEQQHGFCGFALADPIRNMVREMLSSCSISEKWMDERELKEDIIPELGVSYRHLAQTLGTEWGRGLHASLWVRLAESYLKEMMLNRETHFVVSDVRFANEASWIQSHGGVIWRVKRDYAVPVREHASETEVDEMESDWTLDNNGRLEDLGTAVCAALVALS